MMRKILSVLICLLLPACTALASQTERPPVLTLDENGWTETPVTAGYSWASPGEETDAWTQTQACGTAPTDPEVYSSCPHVLLDEDTVYTVGWDGTPPDELIVASWDMGVFWDQEHIDRYQENSEIIVHTADGKITLRPDRVYSFQARWLKAGDDSRPYGNADYYLVTEKLIMLDGPGMVMPEPWVPSSDPAVTDALRSLFEKGTASSDGASSVPVAYLGSQGTVGTKHAFLCRSVSAYPGFESEAGYVIVYLFEDPQGNVSMLNAADFDIGSLCTDGDD